MLLALPEYAKIYVYFYFNTIRKKEKKKEKHRIKWKNAFLAGTQKVVE